MLFLNAARVEKLTVDGTAFQTIQWWICGLLACMVSCVMLLKHQHNTLESVSFSIGTDANIEGIFTHRMVCRSQQCTPANLYTPNTSISSVIFVNENENGEKRENNEFVNEN